MPLALSQIASTCISSCPFTFAQVLKKLERMLLDPDCTSQLISSIILSDPMLCALTLSRANASEHANIVQINQAVSVLGLSMVHGFCDECQAIESSKVTSMAQQWAAANACAAMTRILGPLTSFSAEEMNNPETLSCLGLLHDIGNILCNTYFEEQFTQAQQSIRSQEKTFGNLIKEDMGLRPSDIGALFAQSWHLPAIFVDAIRYHTRPNDCARYPEIAALVHVAHNLTTACGYHCGEDKFVTAIEDDAIALLGLNDKQLRTCVQLFFKENEELSMYEGTFAQ